VIDLSDGTTRTLVGSAQSGHGDDPPRFNEPAGISAAGGKLYIADTNNHAIRVIDLKDDTRVRTLLLEGLKGPR
jgi:DNA-binding beta-propeller fold protein YncE